MPMVEDTLGPRALSALAGYLAQRSNVCAKVIDRDGRVTAIAKRGLELLGTAAEDICGAVWEAFWQGNDRDVARAGVDCAFAGKPCEFVGTFHIGGVASAWEVEILPLDWRGDQVTQVLVLSTRLGPSHPGMPLGEAHPDAGVMREVSSAFHALSAAMGVASRGAGVLRNGIDAAQAQALADALDSASRNAAQAIEDLAALLGTNPQRGA